MILEYNGKAYEVTDESIYRDFFVIANGLEGACSIVTELADMVVVKRTITITDSKITVGVRLREKTAEEKAVEELQTLRSDIEDFASTASKTNAAKINAILTKGVSTDGNTTR